MGVMEFPTSATVEILDPNDGQQIEQSRTCFVLESTNIYAINLRRVSAEREKSVYPSSSIDLSIHSRLLMSQ